MLHGCLALAMSFALCAGEEAHSPGSCASKAETGVKSADAKAQSPWMVAPLLSSSPKVGTAVSLMGAYVKKFDPVSPASMLGAMVQYSNTDSRMGVLFFRGFHKEDRLRITAVAGGGRVNNAYQDFLGTGLPANTQDNLRFSIANASWRFFPNLYAGVQVAAANYVVTGDDPFSQEILNRANLTGFASVGLGLLVQYDTRDNVNSPTRGRSLKLSNLAFSERLGGDVSFDNYVAQGKAFAHFGDGHVLAGYLDNRWTMDAPSSGQASVQLRGYTQGQYLGESMSSAEVEWRHHLSTRWGAKAFAGVAWLYGGDSPSLGSYPSAGLGTYFVLRPQDGMVLCLEGALGKEGNYGIYLRFGHSF